MDSYPAEDLENHSNTTEENVDQLMEMIVKERIVMFVYGGRRPIWSKNYRRNPDDRLEKEFFRKLEGKTTYYWQDDFPSCKCPRLP